MTLELMLKNAGIQKQSCYKPADVVKLLNISYAMFIKMTDCWEPAHIRGRNRCGLECYRVGTHRRVPHHALVEYLEINANYELDK